MENITRLICYLIAIEYFAKDIHYSCHGEAFYGKHLFADLVSGEMSRYVDDLKETCLLANEIDPLPSREYLNEAAVLTPVRDLTDDKRNFAALKNLIIEALSLIESMEGLTRGENSLIDDISRNLQKKLGLINRQLKE